MKNLKWVLFLLIPVIVLSIFGIAAYYRYIQKNGTPEVIVERLKTAMQEFEPEEIAGIVVDRNSLGIYWNSQVDMLSDNMRGYVMERSKDLLLETGEISYEGDSSATVMLHFSYVDGKESAKEDYKKYFDSLYKKHYYSFEKEAAEAIPDYVDRWWVNDELIEHVFPGDRADQTVKMQLIKVGSAWRIVNDDTFNIALTQVLTCGASEGVVLAYKEVAAVERTDKERRRGNGSYSSGTSGGASSTNSSSGSAHQQTRSNRSSGHMIYNADEREPDDYDVEGFYYDNRSDFESVDDAWDYLEDEPDEWD